MITKTIKKNKTNAPLTDSRLIEEALEWHHQATEHACQMVICAKNSGDRLNKLAKRHRGSWEKWASENLSQISLRSIRVYRSVANNWSWLKSKVQDNNLSLEDARKAISLKNQEKRQDYGDHKSLDKVNVKKFVEQLEAASLGLAQRDIIEQSTMFVFAKGRILTYNDEIACSIKCDLPLEFVVYAQPLLKLLKRLDETFVKIEVGNEKFKVKGHRIQSSYVIEKKVLLPIEDVPRPQKWKSLPDEFCEAVKIVAPCAGSNETQHSFVHVHLTESFIEAGDGRQLCRYRIETGIKPEMLIRAGSLMQIADFKMTEWSISSEWIHFRNDKDMIISCRIITHDECSNRKDSVFYGKPLYPSYNFRLENFEGMSLTLPKGLKKAISRSHIFTKDIIGTSCVRIDLNKNTFKISGLGPYGDFEEDLELDYSVPKRSFFVRPDQLLKVLEMAEEYTNGEISIGLFNKKKGTEMILINESRFMYLSTIGEANEDNGVE